MKKIISTLLIGIITLCCKENAKDNFSLVYIKDNNNLYLNFKNNTNYDIVFLVPNTLEFGDKKYKSLSTQGGKEQDYPINVYALIQANQSSVSYQKKLDSIRNNDFLERGMMDFIKEIKPGDGNSVFHLNSKTEIKVRYNLVIKSMLPVFKKSYSSTFKQNYYPYDKVLKGVYPEGEYLIKFSKLNFGKAKFVAQPVIEDSLVLKLSEKDITN